MSQFGFNDVGLTGYIRNDRTVMLMRVECVNDDYHRMSVGPFQFGDIEGLFTDRMDDLFFEAASGRFSVTYIGAGHDFYNPHHNDHTYEGHLLIRDSQTLGNSFRLSLRDAKRMQKNYFPLLIVFDYLIEIMEEEIKFPVHLSTDEPCFAKDELVDKIFNCIRKWAKLDDFLQTLHGKKLDISTKVYACEYFDQIVENPFLILNKISSFLCGDE